jgi:AraC-like DNA-binding protein
MLAMSTTGIRLETDSELQPEDLLAVILPGHGSVRSSLWGAAVATAGSSMGSVTTQRGRRVFEGFANATLTTVNTHTLKDTWLAMTGPEMAETTPFPELSQLDCLPSSYGQVDFIKAFASVYRLIDSFGGQQEALRKLHLDDTVNRTVAAALTPELFWGEEVALDMGLDIKRRSIDAICDRTREDPSSPLSLTQMEKISGFGKRTLQTAFRERFGMSPIKWQINERLNFARDMLREQPHLRIAEVARQTGFATPSAFSQAFRDTFGTSPSKSRRNVK